MKKKNEDDPEHVFSKLLIKKNEDVMEILKTSRNDDGSFDSTNILGDATQVEQEKIRDTVTTNVR